MAWKARALGVAFVFDYIGTTTIAMALPCSLEEEGGNNARPHAMHACQTFGY